MRKKVIKIVLFIFIVIVISVIVRRGKTSNTEDNGEW